MKIFGIGLSKTGTSSLAVALKILGYKTRDYMGFSRYTCGDLSSVDLEDINKNDAFTDFPIPSFYKELDAEYPDSKFILTVRGTEGWLKSCKKQFNEKSAAKRSPIENQVFMDLYGATVFDKEKFKIGYDRFTEDVLDYFQDRKQDLLVIDICAGEGWEKLCPFLNKTVIERRFPKSNVTEIQWINIKDIVAISKQAGKGILKTYETDFNIDYKKNDSFKEWISPVTLAHNTSNKIIVDQLKKLNPNIPIISKESKNVPIPKRRKWHHFWLIIAKQLQKFKPNIPIGSEESNNVPFSKRKEWHHFWLIDPLDGTKEFINKNGEFTVNIALIQDGKPIIGVVYAPVKDIVYYSKSDIGSFKQEAENEPEKLEAKKQDKGKLIVVTSRSHFNKETEDFIKDLGNPYELISAGSALRLCLIAENKADIYPSLGPTMEWDTAAGHAIVKSAGKNVTDFKTKQELTYNKENFLNPWFVAE